MKNKIFVMASCWIVLIGIFSRQPIFAAHAEEINERAISAAAMSRLLGAFGSEPLIAVYTHNALNIPELFAQTNLSKMLYDPAYAKGFQTFQGILTKMIGTDLRSVCPEFSRHMSGPMVLAVLPRASDTPEEDGVFQIVLLVQAPNEGSAAKLKELWPKNVPPNSLLAFATLRTVLVKDLPEGDKVPTWAIHAVSFLGGAHVGLCVQPRKVGEKIKAFLRQVGMVDDLKATFPGVNSFEHLGIERLIVSTTFDGEYFKDELHLELSGDEKTNTLCRLSRSLKEQPSKWDSLQTALPGGEDALVLLQLDPDSLGNDLPLACQAAERYLRGRRWARTLGKEAGALSLDRFKFLFDKMQGGIGIVAHPALSGDLRLVIATALKADEQQTFRDLLIKGFGNVGADFQTLMAARKIGASSPLGATFTSKGIFSAPIVGLSPGWAWFCSNSSAYQELTTAFKTGKTLAADLTREKNIEKKHISQAWRDGDALRIQIEMEKTIRLGYTAWLLSGSDGPFIFGWKVPGDMLPPPAIFAGRLGLLRIGFRRQKDTLDGYSSSVFPGTPLLGVWSLLAMTDAIERSRSFATDAKNAAKTKVESDPAHTKDTQDTKEPEPKVEPPLETHERPD
jgi:hypothetical protein